MVFTSARRRFTASRSIQPSTAKLSAKWETFNAPMKRQRMFFLSSLCWHETLQLSFVREQQNWIRSFEAFWLRRSQAKIKKNFPCLGGVLGDARGSNQNSFPLLSHHLSRSVSNQIFDDTISLRLWFHRKGKIRAAHARGFKPKSLSVCCCSHSNGIELPKKWFPAFVTLRLSIFSVFDKQKYLQAGFVSEKWFFICFILSR